MASRRTRIKGIANIPQRRKNTSTNEEYLESQVKLETCQATASTNLTLIHKESDSDKEPQVANVSLESNDYKASNYIENGKIAFNDPSVFELRSNDEKEKTSLETAVTEYDDQKIPEKETSIKAEESYKEKAQEPKTDTPAKKPLLMRRKFIKPTVSAGVINRKIKQVSEKEAADDSASLQEKNTKNQLKDNLKSDITIISNRVIPPKDVDSFKPKEVITSGNKLKPPTPTVLNNGDESCNWEYLDEVHLSAQNVAMSKPEAPIDNSKKLAHQISNTHNSDTEYPPPPPSPSKINRSRIKAIPRLGYRKTSFSASESEDESRRNYNRNRNDSVCSTASGVPESIAECMSPQRPVKEYNTVIQKKCSRTEQSRKLAEARREFQRRFGANKPDRKRLTMIDLIFYNPTSNPMTNDGKSKVKEIKEAEEVSIEEQEESEKIDDPGTKPEAAAISDEENEMPVPQIKIGPSGEIILDEKSLVIESKEVAKQREELQKTQLVDGDFDTGYGVYKRQKKSKDWSHNETLRFYKALNTIGTDFTLMCELFPRRNRRELKMKFKKEEKINRALIDRAIMQPCRFDYVELKHEVDMEEKELRELQKQKEEELKLKKEKMERIRKRKASKEEKVENILEPVLDLPPKPPKIRKVRKPRIRKLSIESVLEDSDADESDMETQSESDTEVILPLKPTRSGRIPKVAKKFDEEPQHSVQSIIEQNEVSAETKTNDIEPGSIMIITGKGANGEPVYKLFMVTPDKNATPLNLTSDILTRALAFKKGVTAQNIMTISASATDDEGEQIVAAPAEEKNVTIPADENITSLKSSVGKFEENNIGLVETTATADEDNAILETQCSSEPSDFQVPTPVGT